MVGCDIHRQPRIMFGLLDPVGALKHLGIGIVGADRIRAIRPHRRDACVHARFLRHHRFGVPAQPHQCLRMDEGDVGPQHMDVPVDPFRGQAGDIAVHGAARLRQGFSAARYIAQRHLRIALD